MQLITGPDTNIYWMRYDDNGGEVRRIRSVGAGNTPPVAEVRATPTKRRLNGLKNSAAIPFAITAAP